MGRVLTSALLTLPLVGAFSMFALGIVVIYRASRVLNLAHGAMATLPAYVAYSMVNAGVPLIPAIVAATFSGALLGVAVERFILRPLRDRSPTAQTVGTVAVLGVLISLVAKIWGTAPLRAPNVFPEGNFDVGASVLHYGEIGLFLVAAVASLGLTAFFLRTDLGLLMRAAAQNRRAAQLMGADPDRLAVIAWGMGGALAALAGVLLAGVTNLHPQTLSRQVLPGFVAALLGGLESLSGSLVGAVVVGLAQGVVAGVGPLQDQPGSPQLVLTTVALIVMASRGRRLTGVEAGATGEAMSPRRIALSRWQRRALWILVVPAALWPWLPIPPALRADANLAALYAVVGVALVVLTGWVGQISLAHASFVGLGAFLTGLLVRGAGIPFPANLPLAAAGAGLVAMVLGSVALRVRGLYLAVATLIFGWMADAYLFKASWFVGVGGSSTIPGRTIGRPGTFPSFDFTDRRVFWVVALAGAALAVAAASNLRDSKTGRAFFAVRGSELAAASLGINVARTKLLAFGVSGVMAGMAGNLLMVDQRTASPEQFSFSASLFFLSIAVVGGLTRLSGVLVAAAVFAGFSGLASRIPVLDGFLDLVSSALLLAAVMVAGRRVRVPWLRGLLSRFAPPVAQESEAEPSPFEPSLRLPPHEGPVTEVRDLSVRFGGLVALDSVSLYVEEGEVVGLIGPNGAGKTTLFNAVGGIVSPSAGQVRLFGKDVTSLGVHERAALGLGRTFQVIQLFREASVFDNLLVGTHLHSRTGPLSHLFVTRSASDAERAERHRVREVLALVGLEDVAHARAGDLPFGLLRRVEVGRAFVTGARFVMLDEPASGLDERETDELTALLRKVREEMGMTLLVVEHDVRFVTGLSDRLYVLDGGRIISHGPPDEVRRDPAVLAAYLGGAEVIVRPGG